MVVKRSSYPSSEAVLYKIVQLVCDACLKRLKDFSNFKAKYTTGYVNDILDSLAAAQKLPSYSSRQGKQGNKRTTLATANTAICRTFQKLLRYMNDAFEPDRLDDMRREAGGDFYAAASAGKWDASTQMQANMAAFMNTYAAELAAGGMTPAFAANFTALSEDYAKALFAFSQGKTSSGEETGDKTDANNDLYQRIRNVMADGREIFEEEPGVAEQFSYQWLAKKLGGQGHTGFRISLKEADTLVPVTTASVSFLPTGEEFSIEDDKKGVVYATLPELKDKESYSYLLIAPGYEEMAGTLVADTGVMHRVSLVLKRAVMSAVPERVVKAS